MKKKLLIWSSIFAIGFLFTNATIDKEDFTPLPWSNGILNGEFHIQTKQGSIEGEYKRNQKVGNWTVYDEKGSVLQERIYKNNFEYSIEEESQSKPVYELKRNSLGLYNYYDVKEEVVLYSKRVWRFIDEKDFKYMSVFTRGLNEIDQSKISIYTSDELNKKHSIRKDKPIEMTFPLKIKIVGDLFYDSQRKISEYRVLAICPIFEGTDKEYWFYYPDIRAAFGKTLVDDPNRMIHNVDDLFFFGVYPHLIYKVENIEDIPFNKKEYKTSTIETIKEQLETEVSFWVKE